VETILVTRVGDKSALVDVELLAPNLGRVVDDVYLNPLSPGYVVCPIRANDIVRLSRDPGEGAGELKITEIAMNAGPRLLLSKFSCPSAIQLERMIALAPLVGGEIFQVRAGLHDGTFELQLFHPEEIDINAVAAAGGITDGLVDPFAPACHLCKVKFYADEAYLLRAMALVLGAEFLYATSDEIVLFQPDDVDLPALAAALHIGLNPNELLEIDVSRIQRRPGATPGPEWSAGVWGSSNVRQAQEP